MSDTATGGSGTSRDERLDDARAALARAGVQAAVSLAGANAEILAVKAEPAGMETIAEMVQELKLSSGARYVALELTGEPAGGAA